MIIGLQIIAILFSLSMVYFAVLNYKRREINKMEILGWMVIWTGTIIVVVFPELLRTFASTFLFSRVFDMMVVGAFILVISMVVVAYLRTKRLEKKLEEIVRKEAIKKAGK